MPGIKSFLTLIQGAFSAPTTPLTPLPPPLLSVGANMRTGLSAEAIAARIISRMEGIGAPVVTNADGSPSIPLIMETIRVEEIINALLIDGKLEIVINPGVPITGAGANAGGPIVVQGVTTSFASGSGVIR